ncbi:hypothetical protein FOL46_005915 [Perkinsus olseni]|uniref:Uncharacterized protein n=1 Tax=Perkinsus olseni TaxID=32597 RepID=A0A7J6MRB6_PEROL|nr:hypothetical protein FOL46_005915 [Perkinsus olseni]
MVEFTYALLAVYLLTDSTIAYSNAQTQTIMVIEELNGSICDKSIRTDTSVVVMQDGTKPFARLGAFDAAATAIIGGVRVWDKILER